MDLSIEFSPLLWREMSVSSACPREHPSLQFQRTDYLICSSIYASTYGWEFEHPRSPMRMQPFYSFFPSSMMHMTLFISSRGAFSHQGLHFCFFSAISTLNLNLFFAMMVCISQVSTTHLTAGVRSLTPSQASIQGRGESTKGTRYDASVYIHTHNLNTGNRQ